MAKKNKGNVVALQTVKQEMNKIKSEISSMKANDKPIPKKRSRKKKRNKAPSFGPVTSIATAPVAIGNSIRGARKTITKTATGVSIAGRDFMFTPIGTAATILGWTMVGGTPLTPAAFADSVIANYQRMYMKFRFRKFVVHYITSSPTSANGDVVFYYSKDRSSVFLNQTSSSFLKFVFTDQNTVLGPQWTNHTASFGVTSGWKLTDYGMHDGIEEYADGECFLLSKTTSADSPGYVIFDYVVDFSDESFQPRLLTFPIPRIQWKNIHFVVTGLPVVKDVTGFVIGTSGNDLSGVSSTLPNGIVVGDIFKVIFDVTNSNPGAWIVITPNNAVDSPIGSLPSLPLSDGFTCYACYLQNNSFNFFMNATTAFTGINQLRYGLTGTVTFELQAWVSYVGSNNVTALAPNY